MDAETFHDNVLLRCGWHNICVHLRDRHKLAVPADGVQLSWDSSSIPLVRPQLLAQEADIPFYVTGKSRRYFNPPQAFLALPLLPARVCNILTACGPS